MGEFLRRFSLVEREQVVEKTSRCLWMDEGKPGRDYLINVRGLSEKTIKDFQLGYMPKFVDHQLSGRIIFPIFDPSGNLITISSRRVESSSDFLPVYWHESYEKSFYLYGSNLARQSMHKYGFALICEGQFDVLQLYNHGVHNVVGLSGNKMSDVQISVIQRYCDEIILLLDVDENKAGQIGSKKIIAQSKKYEYSSLYWPLKGYPVPINVEEFQIPVERKLLSVALPENLDPDEFVRKYGIQKLKEIVRDERHKYYEHTRH